MTSPASHRGTLGTFTGVFTPSILTILGIILFLRLGFVTGNGGLRNTMLIIGIATTVSLLTSVSLAAISTNIEVRGGGDYYMISRTLGVEFGGAIGIVLFLAQSVSIAFYAVGFGEAIVAIVGVDASWAPQVIAAGAILGLFVLSWLGADVATRFQFVVMGLLILALGSFYIGAIPGFAASEAGDGWGAPSGALGFWAIFAIFFPAVTGFTQGVSMSGDLRDPSSSLPRGTFAAVGLSTIVYLSVAILIAGNRDSAALIEDTTVMRSVAAFGPLIDAGVIAATLSSAMASFLGGPRILQSLAADRVFPILLPFARGHGPSSNPRPAVLLSLVIALATVALGTLNVIAPVVSMFFLISYGLLNYATYYEARAASPSFRPRFRFFDKRLSLAGALACLGAMLAINVVAGSAAFLVLFAIHQYLRRVDRPKRWADASRSYHFQRAKESIRSMKLEGEHARSWRPQVLAFSADPHRRERLLTFASWLEGKSGLTAAIEIVVGEGAVKRKERRERQAALLDQITGLGLDVHGRAVLAPDAMEALPVIVQSFGMGPLKANTVLFGWPENPEPERLDGFTEALREVERFGVHVVSMLSDEQRWAALAQIPTKRRRIDVWWQDDDASRLALLAAYLFTRTSEWSRARIRVIGLAPSAQDRAATEEALRRMADDVRIPCVAASVLDADVDMLAATSEDATIALLPMRLFRNDLLGPFDVSLWELLDRLPMSAAILAGSPFDLSPDPETETQLLLSAAEERIETAAQRLRTLERQLVRLDAEVVGARASVDSEEDPSDELIDAELRRENLIRRIVKARVRLEAAKRDVEAIVARDRRA